jgi:hypothetical protein
MNNTADDAGGDGRPGRKVSALQAWLAVLAAMSIFAYVRLSTNKAVMPMAILLLCILEVVQFVRAYRETRRLEAWCEVVYCVVLLSVFLGAYRHSIVDHRTFMFATVFYRPFYTRYCNRRLSLILCLLIMAAVCPVTCGIVTNSDFVDLLTALYALLVACLWLFCSKLGARAFGFEQNS